MKKLYLLLDEWDSNRNFVGDELRLIREKYDVTIVCNSAYSDLEDGVRYLTYTRPSVLHALVSLLKGLADRELWHELGVAFRYRSDVCSKVAGRISEAVRFYINADLFRGYMKEQGCMENGAIYYSYWNFWKCYAVTHIIDRYPGSRVISRIHGYELYDEQIPSGYQPFKNAMDAKLDKLIFVSETGKEHYLDKFGKTDSDKYVLYLLGTRNSLDREACLHGSYREGGKDFLLVSCSRIDSNKRVERIAKALSLINDLQLEWVHFGTGDLEDAVRSEASALLDNKVNIRYEFRGLVNNGIIHEFYRERMPDAFITASASEGNPVSVMEALSYGIPVIAPAICNFPNMIADCGILVSEECSTEELADAVVKIAGMPGDDIRKIRYNARKRWENDFDADKNNRRFVEEVLDREC